METSLTDSSPRPGQGHVQPNGAPIEGTDGASSNGARPNVAPKPQPRPKGFEAARSSAVESGSNRGVDGGVGNKGRGDGGVDDCDNAGVGDGGAGVDEGSDGGRVGVAAGAGADGGDRNGGSGAITEGDDGADGGTDNPAFVPQSKANNDEKEFTGTEYANM